MTENQDQEKKLLKEQSKKAKKDMDDFIQSEMDDIHKYTETLRKNIEKQSIATELMVSKNYNDIIIHLIKHYPPVTMLCIFLSLVTFLLFIAFMLRVI